MAIGTNCLIVGGGIAGLAAAVALAKVGIHTEVLEIGDGPDGAAMSLTGRAADAMVELGIYDDCYTLGAPFSPEMGSPVLRDTAGEPLGPPPPPRPVSPDFKPGMGIMRPVFAQIIEKAALAHGAKITRGVTADAIVDTAGGSIVTLSNGEERQVDFVIGADGINSRVRSLLFPEARQPEYSGQWSIRWMIPGPPLPGEGWYVAGKDRLGFFYMPAQALVYVPIVLTQADRRLSQDEAVAAVDALLAKFTSPAIVNLRANLKPDSILISRAFRWHLVESPWHRGNTMLIGDAAHATTAHMGMGAGMALEDAVVLAQEIAAAETLADAYDAFMLRRFERVKTVALTSLALSRLEQEGAPPSEAPKLQGPAFAAIAGPY
jgi:2-polyprenyl-6-methoxyphenol hydroxylase-like FAD-dependent oxidoreductase